MKKIIVLFLMLLCSQTFAWDIIKNKKGALTGYSTPINSDAYKYLNIDPNDQKQYLKSPNVMTDLFSAPQKNYNYDSTNTIKNTGGGGIGAKCGVSIIYD